MKLDPIARALFAGYLCLIVLLVVARWWLPQDREIFTFLSGTATGFGTSFFTWLRSSNHPPPGGVA
jgi:hypothetical protein